MTQSDLIVYAGCVGGSCLLGAGSLIAFARSYAAFDAVRHWSPWHDAVAKVSGGVVTALLCAAWGAIYASRSEAMGNDAVIGALWGLGGAAGVALGLGPVITARLKKEIETRREQ